MKLTQQHLKKHPEKLERFDKVRIWSGQWGAWWRPDGAGYTERKEHAGIYGIDSAWACVSHCGREKKISLLSLDQSL